MAKQRLYVNGIEVVAKNRLKDFFVLVCVIGCLLFIVYAYQQMQGLGHRITYNTQRIDILDETFNAFMNDFLMDTEGGYVNDKFDNGGETKYGISHNANPDIDIRNLTEEQAKEIYYERYYVNSQINKIESVKIRMAVLDIYIHSGRDGITQFQKVLNRDRENSIDADGYLGTDTFDALGVYISNNGTNRLLRRLRQYRERLMRHHEDYRRYRRGWSKRLDTLDEYLASI